MTNEFVPVVAVTMQSEELVHVSALTVSPLDQTIAIGVLHVVPASVEKVIFDAALMPPATIAPHDETPKQLKDRIP
jgi:hypothetical protein